jgi:Lrp/AsnC family transcriptional regulator
MTYRVALHESDEGFSVWVPGLPGCVSQGTTEEEALANIADAIREYPEVQACHTLMGEMDFLVQIVTEDVPAYERFFFDHLSQIPGVQEVHSNIAMSEIKATTAYGIPPTTRSR